MTNIKNFIDSLKETRSSKEKIKIISEYSHDQDITQLLEYTYGDNVYHIKKVPVITEFDNNNKPLSIVYPILDLLKDREITGNAAIELLSNTLSELSEDDYNIAKGIIVGNLGCSINKSSINKGYSRELLFEYPCLLAKNFEEKYANKLVSPYYTQMKYDGARINIIKTNDNIEYRTRSGKQYFFNNEIIEQEINTIYEKCGFEFVLDGEMIIEDNGLLNREKSNGIANKAIKGTITQAESDCIVVYCWDIIPYDDFRNKKCDLPYQTRFSQVEELIDGTRVRKVESYEYFTLEECLSKSNEFIANGYEGGMIKSSDLLWENKRSTKILKVKGTKDADLLVTGFIHGDVNKGLSEGIGSLICQTSDGKLTVNISSGLTHTERGYIKNEKDEWVIDPEFDLNKYNGKIVEVNYASMTESNGMPSLFTCKLIRFRDDKEVANSFDDLI